MPFFGGPVPGFPTVYGKRPNNSLSNPDEDYYPEAPLKHSRFLLKEIRTGLYSSSSGGSSPMSGGSSPMLAPAVSLKLTEEEEESNSFTVSKRSKTGADQLHVQAGGLEVSIFISKASKFTSEKDQVKFSHLNMRFDSGLPKNCAGVFAELAGLQPMKPTTASTPPELPSSSRPISSNNISPLPKTLSSSPSPESGKSFLIGSASNQKSKPTKDTPKHSLITKIDSSA